MDNHNDMEISGPHMKQVTTVSMIILQMLSLSKGTKVNLVYNN